MNEDTIIRQISAAFINAQERFMGEAMAKLLPHRATAKFKRHHMGLVSRLLDDLGIQCVRIEEEFGDKLTTIEIKVNGQQIAVCRIGVVFPKDGGTKVTIHYAPAFDEALCKRLKVPDHHPAIKAFIKEYKRQTAAYIGKGKA